MSNIYNTSYCTFSLRENNILIEYTIWIFKLLVFICGVTKLGIYPVQWKVNMHQGCHINWWFEGGSESERSRGSRLDETRLDCWSSYEVLLLLRFFQLYSNSTPEVLSFCSLVGVSFCIWPFQLLVVPLRKQPCWAPVSQVSGQFMGCSQLLPPHINCFHFLQALRASVFFPLPTSNTWSYSLCLCPLSHPGPFLSLPHMISFFWFTGGIEASSLRPLSC